MMILYNIQFFRVLTCFKLEQPIPTQYVTKFDDKGKLVTKPSEHVGV